jgi:biotin carboxyl carrier protein
MGCALGTDAKMKYLTTINDKEFEIDMQRDGTILVNGERHEVDFLALGPSLYSVIIEHFSHEVVVEERDNQIEVLMRGRLYSGHVMDERAQLMASRRGGFEPESGEMVIKAPMPGLVLEITVAEGESVTKGQTVVILESMKMQNELKVPRDGVVQEIAVEPGQSVEQNKVLVTIV